MNIIRKLIISIKKYINNIKKFSRNVRLLLLAAMLGYLAFGIFSVNFNLYIISLGITPDSLGNILSAAPFAAMLASIPLGFITEKVGYRKVFLFIYLFSGMGLLAQVATANVTIITIAAFITGLASSGNFVVRLPFLASNIGDSDRTFVFSIDAFIGGIMFAVGALLAGYLPNLFQMLTNSIELSYRYTLFFSGLLTLLALIPVYLIVDNQHTLKTNISLSPYLWGVDKFLVKSALIEFILGFTHGLIVPFINIFFIFYLNTSREFYSWVEAITFIPIIAASLIGPILALRFGNIKTIIVSRFMIPAILLSFTLSVSRYIGTGSYLGYRAIFSMSQSLWFAFAMAVATSKSKVALSAWLQITFQLGVVLAAQITGNLLNQGNYRLPFILAATAAVASSLLTWILIYPYRHRADPKTYLKKVVVDG
jgi:MFS family permease